MGSLPWSRLAAASIFALETDPEGGGGRGGGTLGLTGSSLLLEALADLVRLRMLNRFLLL